MSVLLLLAIMVTFFLLGAVCVRYYETLRASSKEKPGQFSRKQSEGIVRGASKQQLRSA